MKDLSCHANLLEARICFIVQQTEDKDSSEERSGSQLSGDSTGSAGAPGYSQDHNSLGSRFDTPDASLYTSCAQSVESIYSSGSGQQQPMYTAATTQVIGHPRQCACLPAVTTATVLPLFSA